MKVAEEPNSTFDGTWKWTINTHLLTVCKKQMIVKNHTHNKQNSPVRKEKSKVSIARKHILPGKKVSIYVKHHLWWWDEWIVKKFASPTAEAEEQKQIGFCAIFLTHPVCCFLLLASQKQIPIISSIKKLLCNKKFSPLKSKNAYSESIFFVGNCQLE